METLRCLFKRFHIKVVIIMFLKINDVQSFNIDTKSKVIFSGNTDSYFGYSVVLAGNKWVIIGAPRDSSSDLPFIDRPGALHRCYVSDGKPSCEQIRIDSKFGSDSARMDSKLLYFDHGRTGQWLGGSIQLKDTATAWEIVTCAHRWYNRGYIKDGEYDMNGFCYLIPADLNVANIKKLPAMVGRSKRTEKTSWGQQVYNFAMASMGVSLHVTNEKQNILIGAPGIKSCTGGFVEMAGNSFAYMESDVDRVNDTEDSFIGYALTSGRYFSDKHIYYAAGAPRANLIGKVLFFRSNSPPYVLEDADFELIPRMKDEKSIPMNAYFGSVLCSVDVNADLFDDILVGAPMLAYTSLENDVGAVYLYLGTSIQNRRFGLPDLTLNGSKVSSARFGSAISSLGDLNSDGFNDIVIGAPFEDEGRGAVYIYNGYKDGLWPRHSLKILARVIEDSLFGFGASLSNKMDMNKDNINDIAVGSYVSNNVVLLYGQPVIQMDAWIEVAVSGKMVALREQAMIKRDSTQIVMKTCFRFTNSDTESLTINVTLNLDNGFEPKPRLMFKSSNSQERQLQVKVWRGDSTCTISPEDDYAYIQSTNDLVTPVLLLAKYEVDTVHHYTGDVQPTINKFNGNNPKDPLLEVTRELHFRKDCDENICNTDLHLNATLEYNTIDGFFIMGSPLMSIKVKITKDGDPSYGSICSLIFPSVLRYKKTELLPGTTDVSCFLKSSDDSEDIAKGPTPRTENSTLLCYFGNPLYNDSGVEFQVLLQVPTKLPDSVIELELDATTLSSETNFTDNHKDFDIEVRNHVRASLSGISDPQTMFIKNNRDTFIAKHIYEFANQGPSPLPQASVKYYIPPARRGQGADPALFLNASTFAYPRSTELSCFVHQAVISPPVYIWLNGRLKVYDQQDAAVDDATDNDCTSEQCSYIKCNVTNLPARTTLVTTLTFVIHNSIMEGKSLMLLSRGLVLLDESNLITDRLRFEKTLNTEMLPQTPPKEEVDVTVIVVSVVVGVLLLAIIMLIMYKAGFFKRNIKEELERQKLEKTNSVRSANSQTNQEDRKDIIANKEKNDINEVDL